MLPPLNLADSKSGFFSRKRVDGVDTSGARRPSSIKLLRPFKRDSIHVPSPRSMQTNNTARRHGEECAERSDCGDLTEISMIPREFFVIETNAVLLPPHYPPSQFKSTINAQGQWETVVFPALTPQNRQQVLYLRQTLDKMRATIPQFEEEHGGESKMTAERRHLLIEYTMQEVKLYSLCFHELNRQIQCICKEQSELLQEIRERYDLAIARLIHHFQLLDKQNNQWHDQLTELATKHDHLLEDNARLHQRVEELEEQMKAGPSVAEAQEALRNRGMLKFRGRKSLAEAIDEEEEQENNEDGDSDLDEEEKEWRRQRNSSSVARPVNPKYDPTKELHLAATRLQAAFQKYQGRKEQTRITIRVEKQAAALDIQRSYRGFRDRQFTLHRRAIMRTILRRREENAAVELMQANVRAYLINRRRSTEDKPQDSDANANSGEADSTQNSPTPLPTEDAAPTECATAVDDNIDANAATGLDEITPEKNLELNPRQALMKLLSTFRELASVIAKFRHQSDRNQEPNDVAATTSEGDHSDSDEVDLPSRPDSAAPSESLLDEEAVELFQQTMQEAQALVGSLHVVLGTVPEEIPEDDDAELSTDSDDEELGDMATSIDIVETFDQQASSCEDEFGGDPQPVSDTSKLQNLGDDELDDDSLSIPFGERDALRLQNYAELHLDDSLWSSAQYYPTSSQDMAEADARLAIVLASREQKKRLASLKQFISDIYDTIVGKLKELPLRRLEEVIASRCHLSLSFTEWRHQRSQICSRAIGADQPGEMSVPINFNIDELTREHFRCQLGLKQLTDAALKSLHDDIAELADVDYDVKRFQEFLENERSEEELMFCCMCRYLCTKLSSESSTATAASSYHRQPMFHPVTMREVIDVPHALALAKILFRVEDEQLIVQSDAPLTEIENAVYKQYLPTNGFYQFEAIVTSFFLDADSHTANVTADEKDNESQTQHTTTCRRPSGSPRHASTLLRPTNYNQFHAKQYNTQAARSPLVRRQQERPFWSSATNESEPKWVYFEEVLALLIKYRGEMNHFHLFSYWVQELFSLAATAKQPKLLDDAAFVETLAPLSLGPTERELRNIFHNSLRQRHLHKLMPVRVFTSVTLLLLRNGLLSVSSYAPLQQNRPLLTRNGDTSRQRSLSIREQNEDKQWRELALKWRTQENAFEEAIEAIYHEASPQFNDPANKTRAAHALQLLQLRQELYDLFARRSGRGRDLKRAREVYKILVNERLDRVGGDSSLLDGHLQATALPASAAFTLF